MIPQVNATLIARNTARNLAGLGLPLLVALWALQVLAARLETAHFGVLGLVWVLYGLFAELGLGRATTKYAAEAFMHGAGGDARRIARTGGLLQLGVGLVMAIALAAGAGSLAATLASGTDIAAETHRALLIVAATLPATMVAAAYRGILEAAHRFDLLNVVRVPLAAGTYGLPALIVLGGGGIVTITLVLGFMRIMATAAYVLLARYVIRRAVASQGGDSAGGVITAARELVRFGAWQTASGVLAPLLVYVDRVLLAALAGAAAVGLYTPALELATRLLILPASLMMALFPAFSAWSSGREQARSSRAATAAVIYVVAAVAPLVLLLITLGHDILLLWLNEEFARETALALSVLALGALANATAFVPSTLLIGSGRPDIPPKLYALQLPLYVLAAVWLISGWGPTGAAAAWTLRVCLDAVLHFWAAHQLRVLPLETLLRARAPQFIAGTFVLCIAASLAGGAMPGPWFRVALALLVLGIFGIFVWTYALRADGRAHIESALGSASA